MAKRNLSFFSDKAMISGTWTSQCVLLEDLMLVKTDSKRCLLGLSEVEDHLPFKVIQLGKFPSASGCETRLVCYVTNGGKLLLVPGGHNS